ncbi:hypothetical protein ACFOWA_11845 [Pedobacter lithocola]|uniref:DUF4292 domain-containing protein n=1 Tax=Pedobacter lithocola TaxID=1908239 RepID=A0ABV8PC38_9SPHI
MKTSIFSSLIFILLLATSCVAKAQNQKTTTLSDQTKVVFNVIDEKILEGAYTIIKGEDKVVLRGVYKNNVRIGNWYAFNDDGNVFLRYNYDLKKLLVLDTTSINRLKVDVISNDLDVKEKASIPIPITSIDQYISLLGTELKRMVKTENKNAEGVLEADLITNIDKNGKASYQAKYTADGINVTKRLNINEKGFDFDWIPATYKGEIYASTFSVKAKIDFTEKGGIKQRFIWVY